MGINFTNEQKRVIELRDCNILVSAAAGSGKTAVLVERIIQKILDKRNPADIDRFLIVTFTNAAAAEMRERIGVAIEKELQKDPSNENLLKQSVLVHKAQICTIDSFCLDVIRNEFNRIDLDPGFRIADEEEIKLIISDVLDAVLTEAYEEADEDFLSLVEAVTPGKNDSALKALIEDLYSKAESQPWPKKWLQTDAVVSYECETVDDIENSVWFKQYMEDLKLEFETALGNFKMCKKLGSLPEAKHLNDLSVAEFADIEDMYNTDDFEKLRLKAVDYKFATLPRCPKDMDKELHEQYKEYREKGKKFFQSIQKSLKNSDLTATLEMIKDTRELIHTLAKITIKFIDAMAAEKRDRGIVDFGDVEHFALDIFLDEETGKPTETAMEYAKRYDEIMIDEYQDSNMLQEYILNAISGANEGKKHMFMVGDVKQSIYRFRQARPELFVSKYSSFEADNGVDEAGRDVKIELDANFRSRKDVLSFSNAVFSRVMRHDVGNVEYDDKASLKYGANFIDSREFAPEVYVASSKDETAKAVGLKSPGEIEGEIIADRIETLLNKKTMINAREGEEKQRLQYKDIVVLFRGFGPHSNAVAKQLRSHGIPVTEVSKNGYFSALEIQTLLNLLRIVDNPMQDIALASVMHSNIFDFSDEDMAFIRTASINNEPFFNTVLNFENREIDEGLKLRLKLFLEMIAEFREKAKEYTIYELLLYILKKTDYLSIVSVMPYGQQRRLNIEMLLEKAKNFENTSFKGLFNFLRYIDNLIKYQIDSGEADASGENDNTVRFITIHKSKGLEFPVVFLAGMGRDINKKDKSGTVVSHPYLGLGMDYINPEKRIKSDLLLCDTIRNQILKESMGEELRVLYVAMTRAKEKLIITGCVKDNFENKIINWDTDSKENPLSYSKRLGAGRFFDYIVPAALAHGGRNIVKYVNLKDFYTAQAEENTEKFDGVNDIFDRALNLDESDPNYKKLGELFGYEYPFKDDINMKVKYSVSTLKHREIDRYEETQAEEKTARLFDFEESSMDNEGIVEIESEGEVEAHRNLESKKNKETTKNSAPSVNPGALRGTAMHRAMECFNIRLLANSDDKASLIDTEILRCLDEGILDEEYVPLLNKRKLMGFYESNLAGRMAKAAEDDNLFTEKPFVMGLPAGEVENMGRADGEKIENVGCTDDGNNDSLKYTDIDEMVLIQGIIDAYFIEDNEIVVLDYKTDKVQNKEELIGKYKLQLELYAKALERSFSLPVKQCILYSFSLGKEINL
ncbi:MAG: helicase-exonuclease AddAB subunit AddA [Lachnospiraceae bacterium]|nr:helicase-exonuclease AddAB subunit AddA [Lachnospiraceae bacterium]